MNDDSMIKVLADMKLNYEPAITSTVAFEKTIDNLNTQLENMKTVAIQSAKGVNDAFTSQLGQMNVSALREMNKLYTNMERQNKPIEIKVVTDKAENAMNEFAKSMGIKLDKNLKEQFKGLSDGMMTGFDQSKFDELARNIANSYKIAMDKQSKNMQMNILGDSDDKAIYDYLNRATLKLDTSTVNAKKNVDGFSNAIGNLATQSKDTGLSLDQMAQELEGQGLKKLGANTEDIAQRMTKAVQNVRNGLVDLGEDVPIAEIENFTKESLIGLITNLSQIDAESKQATASLEQIATAVTPIQTVNTIIDGLKNEVQSLGVVTTKTFKDMNNEVYKYIDTYKNIEKGISVSDTYSKNDQGGFDFAGRVVDNKSLEINYKSIQKTHAEALKLNKVYDNNLQSIKESTLEQMKAKAASIQQRVATKGLNQEYAQRAGIIREQLSVLQATLQTEGKLTAEEVKQIAQLKEQLEILRAQSRASTSDDIRDNPSTFGQEWERRSSWFLSGAMFYGTINAAKEAAETIKSVEMGMVEISRVMTDSSFVFDEYRDKLLNFGVDYGQTFDNVQSVALRWAQSGYNVADSLTLTETSLLALNTAELDATNATESMIGIMAQWQLQADDLALVMDKVNITADRYSVTSQDLVDGLLRSSSAAKNMNMTLDETIGLLTVMRESSGRTGAEVGNALNSILSYIQRPGSINTLEDMGIQVFTDATKSHFRNALEIFKDISTSWGSLSSEIQDGFVKSADDAGLFSEELATAIGMQEQWNDVQQRDVSQASAGVYRRNYFIGMIERMSNVQGILNGMMDAEGYSMSENAKSMDTLDKKQQSLKASVEALAVSMGDAGLGGSLKALADGGTGALGVINKMPKEMKDFVMATTNAFVAVKVLQLGMKTFGMETPFALQAVTSGVDGLKIGVMSLWGAIKSGGAGLAAAISANLPLLAITASIGAIIAITNHIKKNNEEQAKAIEVSKENIQSLSEEKQGLQELAKEYSTLKDKQKDLTATADEKVRLLEIQKELVDIYGVSITGINDEGQAYADSTNAIQNRIKALEELKAIEEENLETAVMARDVQDVSDLEKNLEKRKKKAEEILEVQKKIDRYINTLQSKGTTMSPSGQGFIDANTDSGAKILTDYIGNLSSEKLALNNALNSVNVAISEGTTNRQQLLMADATKIAQQLTENGVVISDSARAYATELAKGLSQSPKNVLEVRDELETAIKEFTSSDFEKWSESYKEALSNDDTSGIDKASAEIMKLVRSFVEGKPELDNFALAMESAFGDSKAIRDTATATFDLKTAIGSMGSAAKKSMDELKTLNQAIYGVKHGQDLSIDTILDLIENYGLSTDAIKKTTKGYTIEADALENLRKTKIQTAIDSIDAEKKSAEGTKIQVESRMKYYGLEIEQLGNLVNAKLALQRAADTEYRKKADLMAKTAKTLDPLGMMGDKIPEVWGEEHKRFLDAEYENISSDLTSYENAVEFLKGANERSELLTGMLNDKSYGVSESKGGKKDAKYENKALEEALKQLEHKKKMSVENQESIKAEIAELNRINNLYVKTADERMSMAERIYSAEKRYMDRRFQDSTNWINEKKNLNELSVEEEIAAWERIKNAQSNNIEAQKQATLNLYKLRGQVITESFAKEENTINHLTKIGLLSVQQQIDANKKLYESKATSLEDERKRVENLFGLYKSLLDERKNAIKDAYDERIKLIDEETKKKKDAQDDVIKGIEKELELLDLKENESNHEKKMADLKEQLAYWQVRTSEDARKKVAELTKQIDEAEHDREIELKKQGLEDKKQIAQDEIKTIEDAAKEEREKWEKSYKLTEKAFDDHSTNVIALAKTMSKDAYDEWEKNYLIPLQSALASGDFDGFNSIAGGLEGSIGGLESNVTNSNNAQIYRLANQILDLKRQYEVGGDKNAGQKVVSIYDQLSRLNTGVANKLHSSSYDQAMEYVKGLPKMHGGGKSLSYGAVKMMPGELTFPPDLSIKLEGLIGMLDQRPVIKSGDTSSMTDRRIIQNFHAPLFNSEKTVFEDDTDERSFSRELQRQITNLA